MSDEKEFRCSCAGCGRMPEFGSPVIWIEAAEGMLCESCWKEAVRKASPGAGETREGGTEVCCFCAICKRTPPDPVSKIWIETGRGCICEKCWREIIAPFVGEKIESVLAERSPKKSGPLDVQLGCCLLNKRLLNKALDSMQRGEILDIIAENTETMKSMVRRYVEAKGCSITGIVDNNGTCLVTIKKL